MSDLQILDKMLSPLSMPELRKCAQVSRLWRKKVAVLLYTRSCYAYITRNCKEIVKLCRFVSSLDYCLINSVRIQLSSEHSKNCKFSPSSIPVPQPKAVHDNLMTFPIRILDVHVGVCLASNSLLRQMLLGASGTLEELALTYCV